MSVIAPSTKEQIVLAAERPLRRARRRGVSLRQIGAAAGQRQQLGGAVPLRLQGPTGPGGVRVPAAPPPRARATSSSPSAVPTTCGLGRVRGPLDVRAERARRQQLHELRRHAHQYGRTDVFEAAPRRSGHVAPADVPRAHLVAVSTTSPSRCAPIASGGRWRRCRARRRRPRAGPRAGQPVLPFAVALGDVVDGIVGFLEAPVSAETLRSRSMAPTCTAVRTAGGATSVSRGSFGPPGTRCTRPQWPDWGSGRICCSPDIDLDHAHHRRRRRCSTTRISAT